VTRLAFNIQPSAHRLRTLAHAAQTQAIRWAAILVKATPVVADGQLNAHLLPDELRAR
jgi:hypothetical protein